MPRLGMRSTTGTWRPAQERPAWRLPDALGSHSGAESYPSKSLHSLHGGVLGASSSDFKRRKPKAMHSDVLLLPGESDVGLLAEACCDAQDKATFVATAIAKPKHRTVPFIAGPSFLEETCHKQCEKRR